MSDKQEDLTQIIGIIDNNIQSRLLIYDKADCLAKGYLHGLYKARNIVSQFITINDTHRLLNKKYPVNMHELINMESKKRDKYIDIEFKRKWILIFSLFFIGVSLCVYRWMMV